MAAGPTPHPTLDDVRAARDGDRRRRAPHAGAPVGDAHRPARRAGRAEGREPPAHRLVQGPRRGEQAPRARRRLRRTASSRPSRATTRWRSPTPRARSACACEVFMPAEAPLTKIEGAEALGAKVVLGGDSVDECLVAAKEHATSAGMAFVHPFDDPRRRRRPGHARPRAARGRPGPREGRRPGRRRRARRRRRDRGQVAEARRRGRRRADRVLRAVPGVAEGGRADRGRARALTIADGIAVKQPGRPDARAAARAGSTTSSWWPRRRPPRRWCCSWRRPSSSWRARARSASRRCSAARPRRPPSGTTVAVLSGGNVDAGLLAELARRHETEAGRRSCC